MKAAASLAAGVFLVVFSVYALSAPGRIDIIDGQYRFEVARSLLDEGSMRVRDPNLGGGTARGRDGGRYVGYGIAGSAASLPLVLAGRVGDANAEKTVERQQFFFSFTSAVFGAATAALLFLFYRSLDVPLRSALLWTFVAALATLAFPAATTVFDQAQHACFVLAACLLAFQAARRDSLWLAAAGGVALAILVNYQESYAILFPALGLATTVSSTKSAHQRRRALARYAVFIAVGGVGLIVWAALNYARFGQILFTGKGVNHPAVWGNPLVGSVALLVSPGKSIFLYSPPIALALFGLRQLFTRERALALAVLSTSLAHFALVSSLSFFAGDWCWGPRYFVPVLPLLALGFPFVRRGEGSDRFMVPAIVAAGVLVQLLAISVDHHRFFYERSLPPFFWDGNADFYFRESALLDRPGELMESLTRGVPSEAQTFRPGPYPHLLTYAVFGGWGRGRPLQLPPDMFFWPAKEWMRRYQVFWLLRPWPLWMAKVAHGERPIHITGAISVLLAIGLSGGLAIRYGLGQGA